MKKRVHIYLIYLALISFVVTGVSFSRYSSSVDGSDNAAAAKVVVEYLPISMTKNGVPMTVDEGGLSVGDLKPGDVLIYHFNINNFNGLNSNQVLIKYSISVIFNPDPVMIPLTYDVTPDGTYQSAGANWTYMGFGAQETHSYTLTISWNENDNDPEYLSQQQDIQIQISSVQADSLA